MELHNYLRIKPAPLGLLLVLLLSMGISCSKDQVPQGPDKVTVPEPEPPVTAGFDGPRYADDYTPLAAWGQRSTWNLANVHDPTVAKAGDYFYMYQTDASYGNAHQGNGHFHGRRSKDLVNWEYLGASMQQAPAWVKDSLNGNRAKMGMSPIADPTFGYLAPCLREADGVYRMYYSIVVHELIEGTDDYASWGERPYIGMMETTDLASNQWE